jgi:serine/threonine protein kinase
MSLQANQPGQLNQPLQEGSPLQNYRIIRVLAAGGFSFVYLAHDANGAPVAIKEYLPSTLALRVNGAAHPQIPEEDLAKFRYGMKCFFEEAGAIAHLTHPNVVRVLDFFRANETVYLVMRYERGRTLQEHIRSRRGAVEEIWLRNTFAQLLDGLREVHKNKLLHLDIKPANVYLRNDGTPLLIDFGAVRQMLSEKGMKLPPTYTPGFASPESHARRELLGPWSDIYSVGATMYACFAGAAPQPANARLEEDLMVPARRAWPGKYSAELLDIVDWCLQLDHLKRPQSVLALQKALLGEKPDYRSG